MSPKLQAMREQLVQRIKEANRARREAMTQKTECEHDWKPFKETVPADNPKFLGQAVFKVLGCPKCKRKSYVDLVVTR